MFFDLQVSLVSRIIPSPDWFIGIDSFNLCVNGNWLDSITIEVKCENLSSIIIRHSYQKYFCGIFNVITIHIKMLITKATVSHQISSATLLVIPTCVEYNSFLKYCSYYFTRYNDVITFVNKGINCVSGGSNGRGHWQWLHIYCSKLANPTARCHISHV